METELSICGGRKRAPRESVWWQCWWQRLCLGYFQADFGLHRGFQALPFTPTPGRFFLYSCGRRRSQAEDGVRRKRREKGENARVDVCVSLCSCLIPSPCFSSVLVLCSFSPSFKCFLCVFGVSSPPEARYDMYPPVDLGTRLRHEVVPALTTWASFVAVPGGK